MLVAKDVMTSPVVAVRSDSTVGEVADLLMSQRDQRCAGHRWREAGWDRQRGRPDPPRRDRHNAATPCLVASPLHRECQARERVYPVSFRACCRRHDQEMSRSSTETTPISEIADLLGAQADQACPGTARRTCRGDRQSGKSRPRACQRQACHSGADFTR